VPAFVGGIHTSTPFSRGISNFSTGFAKAARLFRLNRNAQQQVEVAGD
jgi:hypothetical protein